MAAGETAGSSTTLRSGRDDNSVAGLEFLSGLTCCKFNKIVIPTRVEGPAVLSVQQPIQPEPPFFPLVIPDEVEGSAQYLVPALSCPMNQLQRMDVRLIWTALSLNPRLSQSLRCRRRSSQSIREASHRLQSRRWSGHDDRGLPHSHLCAG
jgi:hypothetical protein